MRRKGRVVRLPRSSRRKLWLGGLIGLALAACVAWPAQAQERRRGMDPEERLELLTEKLQLTEEQAAEIAPILSAHDEKRRELFEQRSSERGAMREQMEALRSQMDEELAAVLSADQMESLRELRAETRERFRKGRGGKRGGRPPSDG